MDAKASRLGVTPLSPVTYSSSWNSTSFSVTLPKRLLRAFTRYLICSSWKSAKLLQRTSHTPTITQVGRHRTKATPLWSRVPAHTAPPARTPARLASAGSSSSGLFVRWSVPSPRVPLIQMETDGKSSATEELRAYLQTPVPGLKVKCWHFLSM